MNTLKEFKVGDKFKNPSLGTVCVITKVEQNHYYHGTGTYGPYYHLEYEINKVKIKLTPAMINILFKYVEN